MISHFFLPYINILSRASWSIQQNLEGTGLVSSDITYSDLAKDPELSRYTMVTGWNPGASVLSIIGLLAVLCIVGSLFIILAGYVIKKRAGALVAFVILLLPGVVSMAGFWPMLPLAPESFTIGGTGVTGDILGMLSLIFLIVTASWTITILAADSLLTMRGKFWEVYDHLWTLSGIVAAIFFIADSQVAQHDADLRTAGSDTQRAGAYLLKQVEAYILQCHQKLSNSSASCRWALNIHPTLLDVSFKDPKLYALFGPKSSAEMYGSFGRPATPVEIDKIRSEIQFYNQIVCPVTLLDGGVRRLPPLSPQCQRTPSQFCRSFPDPIRNKVDDSLLSRPVALASECVVPTLTLMQKSIANLIAKNESDRRYRDHR